MTKKRGRGGQRKEGHFNRGGLSGGGWSESFVCAEEGFFFFHPPLYANKEAGFVWGKSTFLCFRIEMRVNGFFLFLISNGTVSFIA